MRLNVIGIFLAAAALAPATGQIQRTQPAISAPRNMAPVNLPAGAETRQAHLLGKVGPQTRAWIEQEAKREVTSGNVSESAATGAAQNYGAIQGGLGDGDIAAIAFLVMMESSKQSDQDLKDVMAGVQQISKQKKALRSQGAAAKDFLGELSQEDSLRLQMAMDRRTRAVQALSNMMKKWSGTDDGVARNMK